MAAERDRSIGLDFSLLRNRINGTVNYYNNETRDLLDRKKIAVSSGRKEVKANVASLNNKGWEVSLSTVNINYQNFPLVDFFQYRREQKPGNRYLL